LITVNGADLPGKFTVERARATQIISRRVKAGRLLNIRRSDIIKKQKLEIRR